MNYRLGRKNKRALLTQDGHEVVVFNKGQEEMAQLVCTLLNKHHKKLNSDSVKICAHEWDIWPNGVKECKRCGVFQW